MATEVKPRRPTPPIDETPFQLFFRGPRGATHILEVEPLLRMRLEELSDEEIQSVLDRART